MPDNDNFLFLSFPGLTGGSKKTMDRRVKHGDDRVGYGSSCLSTAMTTSYIFVILQLDWRIHLFFMFLSFPGLTGESGIVGS